MHTLGSMRTVAGMRVRVTDIRTRSRTPTGTETHLSVCTYVYINTYMVRGMPALQAKPSFATFARKRRLLTTIHAANLEFLCEYVSTIDVQCGGAHC